VLLLEALPAEVPAGGGDSQPATVPMDVGVTNCSNIAKNESSLQSPAMLASALRTYLSADEWGMIASQVPTVIAWDIQTGASGMNWTAGSAASEIMFGGAGTNFLQSGSSADVLIAAAAYGLSSAMKSS
jgi:hypothetical protein